MDKEKNTPTPESVWAFMQESAKRMEALDAQLKREQAERDAQYKLAQEERERQQAERDAQLAQLKREQAERDAQYKLAQKERERQQAERDAMNLKDKADLRAAMKALGKRIGGISNNNGSMAEESFFNALSQSMTFAGVKYDAVTHGVKSAVGKLQDEFDILMFNGTSVAIIEIKYRAHQSIFEDGTLPTKKVQNFRTLFPKYATHKIYLGIAAMSFNDEMITQAKQLGIAMFRNKGNVLEYDTDYVKAY